MTMTTTEKLALQKLVTSAQASELAVFSVAATNAKSAATAIEKAQALIGKNKKADYALVVVRKS